MLLKAISRGDVWNGFFLHRAKKEDVPYRFCGGKDGEGIFSGWAGSVHSLHNRWPYVQTSSFRLGAVFSRSHVQAIRKLSTFLSSSFVWTF